MATNIEGVLSLPTRGPFGLVPLTEEEMAEVAGGGLWMGVGAILGAGLLACVIGAGVGVALYCMSN